MSTPFRSPGERPPAPPPPEATRVAAAAAKLGEPVAAYGPDRKPAAIVRGMLVGGVLVIVAVFASGGLVAGAIATGVVLAIVFLAFLAIAFRPDVHVTVYDNGLVSREGQNTKVVKWERVKSLLIDGRTSKGQLSMTCTLVTDGGVKVEITHAVEGIAALAETLEREIVQKHLLPRARQEIEAGRDVTIGSFQLSKTGIAYKTQRLAWRELERCRREGGVIALKKRAQRDLWAEVMVGSLPNAGLLVLLCEQLRPSV